MSLATTCLQAFGAAPPPSPTVKVVMLAFHERALRENLLTSSYPL